MEHFQVQRRKLKIWGRRYRELTTAAKRVIQGLYSVVGGRGGGHAHCQPGDEVGPVVLATPGNHGTREYRGQHCPPQGEGR